MSDEKLTDSSSIGVDSDEDYFLPCPKISFNHDIFNTLQQYEEELKKNLDSLGQSPHSSESSKVASNINSILSFEDSKTEFSKTESRDNFYSTGGSLDKRFISSDQDHKSYEYEYISYYDEEDDNEPEVEIGGKEKIPTEVKKFANYNFMNTLTSIDDDKIENEKSQESSTLPDGMGVAEGSIVRGNTKSDKITTSDILSDISDSPVEHVQLKHLSDEGDGQNQKSSHTSEENTPDLAILGADLSDSDKNGSDNEDEDSFNSTKASLDKPINKSSPNEKVSDSPSKGNSILSSPFGSPSKQESTFVSHTLEDIPEEPEDEFISPKASEVISGLIDGKSTEEDSNMDLEKNQSGTFNSFISIKNLKSVPNSIISADFVSELNESKNDDKDSILSSFTSAAQSPNKVETPGDSDFNSVISAKNEVVSEFNQTVSSINDKNKTFDSEDFDDSVSSGSHKSEKKSQQSSDFISEIKSEEKSFGSSSFISTTKSTKNGNENSISEIHSGIAINEDSDNFISDPKSSKVISEGGSSDFISFSKSSVAQHANSDSGFISFISSKSSKKIKQDGSSDFISTIKSEKNALSSSEFITDDTFGSKSPSGNSDFISVISTERKKEDTDDDFISTIKSEKESSSNDFVSTIKSEKEQVFSSSGFITTISSEKKEKSESDDFVSTIKSEKQKSDGSSDFVSVITSNRGDSSDFVSTIKSEEQKVSESDDFISTMKTEPSRKSESSAYISFVKSEKASSTDSDDFVSTIKSEKKSTNSSDFVSTIKSENKSSESDDFISTIKSEKQQSESDDFVSTIKSEKKTDTESSDAFVSTIKSEKQSAVTSSEFISVLSSEKRNVSGSSEFISTITTKEASEKASDSDDFVSTIKSEIHKDSAIDEFISTIKSEKDVESSSDEFISTIKSNHSVESSDDIVETISEIQSQKETSDDFESTIKSVRENADKSSAKSENNDSLPDDFISTIKSVETAKSDAESSVTSIKSIPSESSQRSRRRKRKFSSSTSKSQVSINRKSEPTEKSIDDDFISFSNSKATVQSPEKQAENESSDNDNFIFQSPAPKQAKSRLNPEKTAKDNKNTKEEKPVKSDGPGELGNLQNLAANLQASNLSNETVLQLITTLSKIADQNKSSPDHHHHRHRHHHHRSLNTDEIPCIPTVFKKYSSASNTDQSSSSAEPIPQKRSRTKLSMSIPHDTNDFLDLEEISPTSISASDIPQNDEIPKPTFISFREDEKDKKVRLSLSRTKQIGDIPPQNERSPLKVSQNTMNSPSIKLSPIKSKQSPTITRFSSSQYTTSAYPSYGAYPIDENFIYTIRTARVQLASIQNSISISRQKRAMHESRVSSFKYTKNPYNE